MQLPVFLSLPIATHFLKHLFNPRRGTLKVCNPRGQILILGRFAQHVADLLNWQATVTRWVSYRYLERNT